MKKIILFFVLLVLINVAYGDGVKLYFTDDAIKNISGGTINASNFHPYASHPRLEFFRDSLPASNTGTRLTAGGGYTINYYYLNIGGTNYNKYEINFPSGAGGTLYVRAWDDTQQQQGHYYTTANYTVASGTTLPSDVYITNLVCNKKADVPLTPSITQFVDSNTYPISGTATLNLSIASTGGTPPVAGETRPFSQSKWKKWDVGGSEPSANNYSSSGANLGLAVPDIAVGGNYSFKVAYSNEWGDSNYSAQQNHSLAGGGPGGPITKTYNLINLAGGLGINTLAIPVSTPYTAPASATYISDIVNAINSKEASNIVYSVGWWDATTMKPAGYEIKYNSTVVNDYSATGTTGLSPITLASLEADKAYQLYVIKTTVLTVEGTR